MIEFVNQLVQELANACHELPEKRNTIGWLNKAMALAKGQLQMLQQKYPTTCTTTCGVKGETLQKSTALLMSKYLAFQAMHHIESLKPPGNTKEDKAYYRKEKKKVNHYFSLHSKYLYCLSRDYFNAITDAANAPELDDLDVETFGQQLESNFNKITTYQLAEMLAMREVKYFLLKRIHKNTNENLSTTKHRPLQWTGSKVALVELIYALHTEGVFNNGTAPLHEICSTVQELLNLEIKQFHRIYLEIRARKSERTKFLCSLRNNLLHRMEQADEK